MVGETLELISRKDQTLMAVIGLFFLTHLLFVF